MLGASFDLPSFDGRFPLQLWTWGSGPLKFPGWQKHLFLLGVTLGGLLYRFSRSWLPVGLSHAWKLWTFPVKGVVVRNVFSGPSCQCSAAPIQIPGQQRLEASELMNT